MSRPAAGLRLLALPLAQRRSATAPDLIYFHPLFPPRSIQAPNELEAKPALPQRIINRASKQWEDWGKAEDGWRRKLYTFGEKAMDRIAYEEWALKSLDPSLAPKPWSTSPINASADGTDEPYFSKDSSSSTSSSSIDLTATSSPPRQGTVPLLFPSSLITEEALDAHLRHSVTYRKDHHAKWLIYDILGMPLTAPFMLVPVVPNIPFFFLAWRAYSHWKARNASRYLDSLINSKQLLYEPSQTLDKLFTSTTSTEVKSGQILLSDGHIDDLVAKFGLSEQAKIDLRRAISQVEARLREDGMEGGGSVAEQVKAEHGDDSKQAGDESKK